MILQVWFNSVPISTTIYNFLIIVALSVSDLLDMELSLIIWWMILLIKHEPWISANLENISALGYRRQE